MNARNQHISAAVAMLALVLGSASCGDVSRTGRSPSILVIDALTAASGADASEFTVPLSSDVNTLVAATIDGEEVTIPTIFNDTGLATLRTVLKDLGNPAVTSGPSPLNFVTVTRVRVVFRRSDGRNVQGVDVPYAFDGGTTGTITNTPSDLAFELVRHQAKRDPPLIGLIGGGGRFIISTIAEVTFYGEDLSGNDVSATGKISVNFGDFGDPD